MKMSDKLYSLFDTTSEDHWWFVGRRKIIINLAKNIITGADRPRILDIGSGAGATLKRLEELGSATGVDISPKAVSYCLKRGCRRVCLVEEEKLPFIDNTAGLVVSLDVLEHMEHEFMHLREYRRVLQDAGKLLLTVPAYPWLWSSHDIANRHKRRYTRAGFETLLEKEGWEIERLTYFCTLLFPLILVLRLISKAVSKSVKNYNADWNFKIPGLGLNWLCSRIFGVEAAWILRWNLPFGSSLLAVCRKCECAASEFQ